LEIDEIKQLVKGVRSLEKAITNPVDKSNSSSYSEVKNIFEKSLAVNKSLKKGHIITFNDLESKKPKGFGIPASDFQHVIGKTLKNDINQWDFLTFMHIDE